MRIIISPAKKMIEDDGLPWLDLPVFLERAEILKNYIQSLTLEDAKKLWRCNDQLARLNYERFSNMCLKGALSPAIFSYEGIQYQHMAPGVFDKESMKYIQQHLRILSGFYGILKPFDGITPYRLEMQSKVSLAGINNLYEYWGSCLYDELVDGDGVILDLASKEYSKCIKSYLKPQDQFITCIFAEHINEKIVQKATLAKMARGEMVRYIAEHKIQTPEEVQHFNALGFAFSEALSSKSEYIFLKRV